MHPEQIKAAIRMNGTTPARLADELQVTRTTISQVIHGKSVSARIQGRIAEVIGQPVAVIWPPQPSLNRRAGGSGRARQRVSNVRAAS